MGVNIIGMVLGVAGMITRVIRLAFTPIDPDD